MLDFAGWQRANKNARQEKNAQHLPAWEGRLDGLRAPILATRISPRAGSAPLARWQGGSREHGDRMWFSETGHFERRPIPVRTTINPRHQLPHDQSRCITCTLYCHVGQARYSPQTTYFMCHDEDVAKYCLLVGHPSIFPKRYHDEPRSISSSFVFRLAASLSVRRLCT